MDISVIVPFYKGNKYMQQLFSVVRENVRNLPSRSVELLLINDSPDTKVEYDPAWVEGFSLRVLENPENMGIHGTRINGIRQAKGLWIQMLDQDDLLVSDALASQLEAIGDHDVVVANGWEQGGAKAGPLYHSAAHQSWAVKERFYYSVANMIMSPGQCLIRRDAIPAAWLEAPMQINGSDDLLLWLLMFRENKRWWVNERKLYTHVITGENASGDDRRMLRSSMEVLEKLKAVGITPKQERRFRRSRSLAAATLGKGKAGKAFAMLRYLDVLWEKLMLKKQKRKG